MARNITAIDIDELGSSDTIYRIAWHDGTTTDWTDNDAAVHTLARAVARRTSRPTRVEAAFRLCGQLEPHIATTYDADGRPQAAVFFQRRAVSALAEAWAA